jgi:hypothetical protein
MGEDNYLTDRLESQIDWYDKKSSWHQSWHKKLRFLEILAVASIPFLTGYITDAPPDMKIVVGGLGVLIAVTSGVVALFKFQEHWLQYRTTAESLKHHKYLYLTKTAPYNGENAFNLLVESVEGLISKENSNWVSYVKEKSKAKSGDNSSLTSQ